MSAKGQKRTLRPQMPPSTYRSLIRVRAFAKIIRAEDSMGRALQVIVLCLFASVAYAQGDPPPPPPPNSGDTCPCAAPPGVVVGSCDWLKNAYNQCRQLCSELYTITRQVNLGNAIGEANRCRVLCYRVRSAARERFGDRCTKHNQQLINDPSRSMQDQKPFNNPPSK